MNDTVPLTGSQQQACSDLLEFLTSLDEAECDRCDRCDYCNMPLVRVVFSPLANVTKTYRKCLNCGSSTFGRHS